MVSRVIMAMSGGLYIVVATNYLCANCSSRKRGSAMATVITGFTVSLVLGVPIGTFLAGHFDWHYIFLIIALSTVFNTRTLQIITINKGNQPRHLHNSYKL